MELRHLRYFVAVAEEENVSRAALKLHVSQPGISRQIRDLEDEIGFQLFERSAKAVRLTAAGKVFLTEAKEVLQRAEIAVKNAREVANGAGGEIHVGYAPSLTVRILPPTLRKFQEQFPGVRVALHDLSSEEMRTQLREGKLHLALTAQPQRKFARGLSFQEIARYAMCVAVAPSHPLAKLKVVSRERVARESLAAFSRKDYPEYHEGLAELFTASARQPRITSEHDGVTSLIPAVEAGREVALVLDCLACMVGERLKLIPLNPAAPPVPVGALWLKDNESDLAKKFISLAQA
jgi:DNA-binding transcriptional LysR family regulator